MNNEKNYAPGFSYLVLIFPPQCFRLDSSLKTNEGTKVNQAPTNTWDWLKMEPSRMLCVTAFFCPFFCIAYNIEINWWERHAVYRPF